MVKRLRSDFQLSIITLMGGFAVLGIAPFAVYRFMTGVWVMGVINSLLVLCTILAVHYSWKTGDTKRPGLFLMVVNTTGAIVSATFLGVFGLFWLYAAFLANFFLAAPAKAVTASIIAIVTLGAHGAAFETLPIKISFMVTATLVSVFAYIFAYRTQTQHQRLEQLATIDPLTEAYNRRTLETELEAAIDTYQRYGKNYGLMMLDLDYFKHINDRFGHEAGDRVLKNFAQLVVQSTRKVDRLFRVGGEEFVLLLPNTDLEGLQIAADHLTRNIATKLIGPDGPVTVSIGAAGLQPDEDWQQWLRRADIALYQAKDAGRNCAIVSEFTANTLKRRSA
jgi:diguanylate cyclase